MASPAICKYCDQVIYGSTQYWHYWDLETRNFLCTSLKHIEHPYHSDKELGGRDGTSE